MPNNEALYYLGIKAVFMNENKEILLLRVNPNKFDPPRENVWDLPGGRVDQGEDVETALRREIREEMQVQEFMVERHLTTVLSKVQLHSERGSFGLILSVYICSLPKDVTITLDEDSSEYRWVDKNTAAELLSAKFPPEFTDIIQQLE